MPRAPFQVLVFPFRRLASADEHRVEFALFKRRSDGYWQPIAGGGEDEEFPLESARREADEEGGILPSKKFFMLDTVTRIPAYFFRDRSIWPQSVYVIPNYCFAVELDTDCLTLSVEHTEFLWCGFERAYRLLYWEDNRTALWELNERLINDDLPQPL